jgi:hypothetical protein
MISISVDLPAPEGPMMAVSSPHWNSPLTFFRMHFDSEIYKYLQKLFSCPDEKIPNSGENFVNIVTCCRKA